MLQEIDNLAPFDRKVHVLRYVTRNVGPLLSHQFRDDHPDNTPKLIEKRAARIAGLDRGGDL
jgi:hypothetical protein